VEFGFVLVIAALLFGFCLATVGLGYLAVRRHFNEIPLSRLGTVAASAFVAVGLGAAWMTLGFFGLAIGQSLGNANAGSLIGVLLGVGAWVVTTLAYGSRITRRLAELQVMMRQDTGVASERFRLRLLLSAIFLTFVIVVAVWFLGTLSGTTPP
jgi:hypothetical protein